MSDTARQPLRLSVKLLMLMDSLNIGAEVWEPGQSTSASQAQSWGSHRWIKLLGSSHPE